MYNWIKVAPYKPAFEVDDDDYDWDHSRGTRVMGVGYVPDYSQAAFAAIISPEGDVTDYLRIPHLLKRKNTFRQEEKALKESDMQSITDFIRNKKPHVIAIGGESKEALMVQKDFQENISVILYLQQHLQVHLGVLRRPLAHRFPDRLNTAMTQYRN
ncbi:hypothetical protein pipiens_006766 [Culex pipiens pipiens]|uniref:Transcription elongation factor Spt6 YqgF domain-containing protein n=1 Tax=Culex pipiens pipiens TaxID=38569 RepID=A0ABD1DPX0_CULPP